METSDSLEVTTSTKVAWKCASMNSGGQCVMTYGEPEMQEWLADNWDSLKLVSGCDISMSSCHHYSLSDATAVRVAAFGAGTGPIVLDDVVCVGFEDRLADCVYDSDTSDCLHFEDAGVICRRECDCMRRAVDS